MSNDAALPSNPRVRKVEGAYNVRDLGGLPLRAGGSVRMGRVFRGDYPAFAAIERGLERSGLELRTVVDLRRGIEASMECVTWADHGITYHRCPVVAGGESSWQARYASYLTNRPDLVVEAVRRVIDVDGHPALFHCAAGKDRTGVIAALVLSVLGVPESEIVADYVLTQAGLEPILARLSVSSTYAEMLATAGDQRPLERNMRSLLEWLVEQGGAEAWLVRHGLGQRDLERFREVMLAA